MSDRGDFKPKATCPQGHDLRVTGYKVFGMVRCQLCMGTHLRKQTILREAQRRGRWHK